MKADAGIKASRTIVGRGGSEGIRRLKNNNQIKQLTLASTFIHTHGMRKNRRIQRPAFTGSQNL